ncbi:hypothetical protein JL475_39275 [Streptomyces sp. M2CJ-2]|uniref:hypothetical protein n=1 Tax=Streptomyces sp. M2CJ-2 TaxID=2803948 RepID=UPI001928AB55|nr:hypothetical protein [Streptomyces sp. M2CJ-2]MBL3671780.1 hypothetical protein [Streptomyces sp. M2CJ-2]
MTTAPREIHPDRDTTAAPRPRRALRHWPTLIFLALVAAIGFVLAGPVTDASAVPPSPSPAADANAEEPSGWKKLNLRVKGVLYEVSYPQALDPHDPHYKRKLATQIVAKRLTNQVGEGKIARVHQLMGT